MKIRFIFLSAIAATLMTSCEFLDSLDDYKDPEVKYTATYPLNGEWYIKVDAFVGSNENSDDPGEWLLDPYSWGYNKIMLYNTASNVADSIWIDDLGLWPLKAKITCNPKNKLFLPVAGVPNKKVTGESVRIVRGGVYLGGALTAAGNKTDSINIVLEFSDDPGQIYRYTGYRRTGFLEDEH